MTFKFKFQLKDFVYILIILVLVFASVFYFKDVLKKQPNLNKQATISPTEAGSKVMKFVNQQLGGRATSSLESVTSSNGVYKLTLKINSKEVPLYLSQDGSLLFLDTINLDKFFQSQKKSQKKITCKDIPKVDKPELKAFVVSYCPYGLQAQRILSNIVENIPELKNNIRVEYIGSVENGKITSMHGDKEAQENLRQICLREEQPSTYWNYISCHIKKGEVNPCLTSAKVDTKKLANCISDENRGLAYARKDFLDNKKYGINGSPEYVLDNKVINEQNLDFGGRSAEAFKNLICCAFSKKPQFCSKTLDKDIAATYFSVNYSKDKKGNSGTCQ